MKKWIPGLLVILMLTALALSFTVSAENPVIFIADGANGNGTSADSPLKPTTGNVNTSAANPHYEWDSALYQAAKKLETTGGTIVICGPVTLDASNTCGNGTHSRDFIMPTHGLRKITITSFYNGVDYRQTNDAKLILKSPATFRCGGFTVFKNIDILTQGTDVDHPATKRVIAANGNDLYLDVGIRTFVLDDNGETIANPDPSCYPTVVGGSRYAATSGKHHVVIKSGTYYEAAVGAFGIGDGFNGLHTGEGKLTVYGGVFHGRISGTSLDEPTVAGKGGSIDGKSEIVINGGLFYGPVIACSARGYASADSSFTLTVRGGMFKKEGIKFYASSENGSVIEYAPASTLIDFSECDPAFYDASAMGSSYKSYASDPSIGFRTANTLERRVIYIADNGTGDGSSPSSPLKPAFYENASNNTRYRNSVLYQAAEMLSVSGGTIVIVGEVKLDNRHGNGTSKTTQDYYMPVTRNPITITSVYNGVDYRTKGARLILQNPINMILAGETTFENLNLYTMPWTYTDDSGATKVANSTRVIAADGNKLTIGEGVTTGHLNENGTLNSSAGLQYYPSVAGGHRYKNTNYDTDLTVLSGKYYRLCAGNYGISTKGYSASDGTLNLTIGGSAYTYNAYGTSSTSNASAYHSGDIAINFVGGTVSNQMYLVGQSGLFSEESAVRLTVSGNAAFKGSSSKVVYHISPTHQNNAPENVTVDLSKYSGTASQIQTLYNKISGATNIITPASTVTAVSLKSAPTKTVFYAGDFYEPIGLQLNVTVFGSINKTISYSPFDDGFTFSKGQSSPLTAADTSIQVYYNNKFCGTFDITVKPDRPINALGAMIKTDTESQGLRFTGKVMKNAGFDLAECTYGFLVLPSDMLTTGDSLSFDYMSGMTDLDATGYVLRSELNDAQYNAQYDTPTYRIFSATLDGIALQDYKTSYTAVAYLCYEENGAKTYVYSEPIERSVYGVALAACGSEQENEGDKVWLKLNVIDKADAGLDGTYDAVTAYKNGTAILDYMEAMASIEWTPKSTIDLSSYSSVSKSCIYNPGTVYHGLPYCAGVGDLENFSAWLIDGVYQTPASYTAQTIRGNVCSTAPLAGWIRYGNDIIGTRGTSTMIPAQYKGFYAVGEYNWRGFVDNPTLDIINASGDTAEEGYQAIYRALSLVGIGDAVNSRWPSGDDVLGHVRLVAAPPHVVYNTDGTINPDASTLKLTEQTSTVKKYSGYSSNWRVEQQYTFKQLVGSQTASAKYIPIATKEFVTGYFPKNFCVIKDINSASDVTEGLKGTIVSNYDVCSVRVDIKNAATGAVVKTAAEYYNFVRRIDLSTLMSSSDFASLAKGSYRLIVTADVNAQNKVLLDLPFSK
ncbi:MAG: hypothetical protein E7655_00520 [Ruminococcaceae bacterium]|nr:hypothetical protein [Oscillospiraceae bacterium]